MGRFGPWPHGMPATESPFGEFGAGEPRKFPPYAFRRLLMGNRREVETDKHLAWWVGEGPVHYEPPNPPDEIRALVKYVRERN